MWLDFQVSQQGLVFQQAYILAHNEIHLEYLKTLQVQMKRTITALNRHLSIPTSEMNRPWLVGKKCTIADLSFVVWDMPQVLDVCFRGDGEVNTVKKRRARWPGWANWHQEILRVDGVEKFLLGTDALKRL